MLRAIVAFSRKGCNSLHSFASPYLCRFAQPSHAESVKDHLAYVEFGLETLNLDLLAMASPIGNETVAAKN